MNGEHTTPTAETAERQSDCRSGSIVGSVCDACKRESADCQLIPDGTDSGESDWLCPECRGEHRCHLCGHTSRPRKIKATGCTLVYCGLCARWLETVMDSEQVTVTLSRDAAWIAAEAIAAHRYWSRCECEPDVGFVCGFCSRKSRVTFEDVIQRYSERLILRCSEGTVAKW